MLNHYVVCVYADKTPGDVKIAGPFPSQATANFWGRRWQSKNGDNPCWNTVTLKSSDLFAVADSDRKAVGVFAPHEILPLSTMP